MKSESVSVVSATWKGRETLPPLTYGIRQALRNVRHEVIIVDDASRDETYALSMKLAEKAIYKKREGQSIANPCIAEAVYPDSCNHRRRPRERPLTHTKASRSPERRI